MQSKRRHAVLRPLMLQSASRTVETAATRLGSTALALVFAVALPPRSPRPHDLRSCEGGMLAHMGTHAS